MNRDFGMRLPELLSGQEIRERKPRAQRRRKRTRQYDVHGLQEPETHSGVGQTQQGREIQVIQTPILPTPDKFWPEKQKAKTLADLYLENSWIHYGILREKWDVQSLFYLWEGTQA